MVDIWFVIRTIVHRQKSPKQVSLNQYLKKAGGGDGSSGTDEDDRKEAVASLEDRGTKEEAVAEESRIRGSVGENGST
ncbi:hypothetical protein L1887_16351 [Cichorium endivia]|nr:hypothetical protein L1887_16351 [Cichorium endivia]